MAKAFYTDDDGNPLAGGRIYSYLANSTTPRVTYQDQDKSTENTNPVILDAAGRADIWLDQDITYKIVVADSDDVVLYTTDNISLAIGSGGGGSGLPDQTGQGGNYLYTDGTDPLWVPATYAAAFKPQVYQFEYFDLDFSGDGFTPANASSVFIANQTYTDLDEDYPGQIFIYDAGTYRIDIQASLVDQANYSDWFNFRTSYGPLLVLDSSTSVSNGINYLSHYYEPEINLRDSNPNFARNGPSFNDTFIIQCAADQLLDVQIWTWSFTAEGESAEAQAVVTITRLSDDAGPWAV